MSNGGFVLVFPSVFAKNKINRLITNIKEILTIREQQFENIRKENSVIVIEVNDPVFVSSTINLLFGVDRIAITKQFKNDYDTVVSSIAKIGSHLLLKGEKFYVKVEGHTSGYLPKDVEIQATSSLIEKTANIGTNPGTSNNYDKLIYTYLTKSHAYVSIFEDAGLGGIPYGSQGKEALCCIYDELSAVSCLETIREGFDVRIIVCWRTTSNLLNLVKILCRILPRVVRKKITIEFFKVKISNNTAKKYLELIELTTATQIHLAASNKITWLSIPLSPLIFPNHFIEHITNKVLQKNLMPLISLGGLDKSIFERAKEIGLEKHLFRIEKLGKMKFTNVFTQSKDLRQKIKNVLKTKQTTIVKIGPNNVHDILDSLKINH